MKFGILMHKNTQNIGDDIQSFAAANLLPSVDYFLDRETLDDFKTENDEPVATVMSAWYMWSKWNWPPSRYIVPLYVGMHWADHQVANQDGSPVKTEFLTGIGGDYLNSYGPIGCRDLPTLNDFEAIGIKSYFSGCITLTLPKMPIIKSEKEYICAVDLPAPVLKKLKQKMQGTGIEVRETTHYKDYRDSKATWEERTEAVTDLLTIYQNAKCVVTRRLHCALPCLAMEVPVFITNKHKRPISGRFDPYYDWLHNCSYSEFLADNYEYDFTNPPANNGGHIETRNKLIASVQEFAEKYKDAQGSYKDYDKLQYTDDEVIKWRHDTMKSVMADWFAYTRKDFQTIKKLNHLAENAEKFKRQRDEQKDKNAELESKNKALTAENKRYKRILNCRSVKTTIKVRNAFLSDSKKIKL